MRAAFAILLTACAPAFAAGDYYSGEGYRVGKWDLAFNPGWAVPVGPAGDFMSTSWTFNLTGSYQYNDITTFGVEWGWQLNHRIHGTTRGDFSDNFEGDGRKPQIPFDSTIHERLMNLSPYVKVGPWIDAFGGRWRPYGAFAPGLYYEFYTSGLVTVLGKDRVNGNLVGPIFIQRKASSNAYAGVSAGGGFDIQVDENASLGLDLRYTRVFKPVFDWDFIMPTIRINYLF